jgi:hypothetical protein
LLNNSKIVYFIKIFCILVFGLVCLLIGLSVRIITVFICVSCNGFNFKEKVFSCLICSPKSVFQITVGPIALNIAKEIGDPEAIRLGQLVIKFFNLLNIYFQSYFHYFYYLGT